MHIIVNCTYGHQIFDYMCMLHVVADYVDLICTCVSGLDFCVCVHLARNYQPESGWGAPSIAGIFLEPISTDVSTFPKA
jgi:hypothetical protein